MKTPNPSAKSYISHGVGRRKSSVARVYLSKGSGPMIVNKSPLEKYFRKQTDLYVVSQPLGLINANEQFHFTVNVKGGGSTGQACAIRLGLARAIVEFNPSLRKELRKAGFLTRDARKVERKKAGQRGARARFQFSKR